MSVSRQDVLRVAGLARLDLDDAETERFARELSDILGHIDALGELEMEDAPATPVGIAPGAAAGTRLRDDEVRPDTLGFPPSQLAPEWRDGFFLVPRLAAHDQGTES